MKNREKYRDEIIGAIKEFCDSDGADGGDKMCRVIQKAMFPAIDKNVNCGWLDCTTCNKLFAFWLDEEYVEPPQPEVDWSKVPVDTLVRVRNFKEHEWELMHFKTFDENLEYRYETWSCGRTSKTACGPIKSSHWRYCELVEVKDV